MQTNLYLNCGMTFFFFVLITLGFFMVGFTARAAYRSIALSLTIPFWLAYAILWIVYLSLR